MKKQFVILGLTGPVGSGCSTVASFLANQLCDYANFTNQKLLVEIENNIGDYYKAIKKLQNIIMQTSDELSLLKSNILASPNEIIEGYKKADANTAHARERKKNLHTKLKELINTRNYLRVVAKTKWPCFHIVSISNIIIFMALEKATNQQGEMSQELSDYKDLNDESKELLLKIAIDCQEDIKHFLLPTYSKLEHDACQSIDLFFQKINDIKNRLLQINRNDEHWLQNLGNNIRGTGNPYVVSKSSPDPKWFNSLAERANCYLKYMRRRTDGKQTNYFVIDAIRNPNEAYFFRKRYGSFYLCAVYANKEIRHKRKSFSEATEERDQGKNNGPRELYKQDVPSCVLMADYAINNELHEPLQEKEKLFLKVLRFLSLVEIPGCTSPTYEETFMNIAYNLSVRSNCLSRQVGAVITNSEGYIVGAGWNDVGSGQLGCAQRERHDFNSYGDENSMLSAWSKHIGSLETENLLSEYDFNESFCFKDVQSKKDTSKKVEKIWEKFQKENTTIDQEDIDKLEQLKEFFKKNLSVKRLEYARALHAEENAILQVATYGGMGIRGGTIFTTTFPCELCAKKIYQSGIKRIVYTEPYPDSLSESLFLKDGIRQIACDQFEGVKANSFFRLFKPPVDRKELHFVSDILLSQ